MTKMPTIGPPNARSPAKRSTGLESSPSPDQTGCWSESEKTAGRTCICVDVFAVALSVRDVKAILDSSSGSEANSRYGLNPHRGMSEVDQPPGR